MSDKVIFLNPRTCGIYKNGMPRFKTDPSTGKRTEEIDNELIAHVLAYLSKRRPPGFSAVPWSKIRKAQVLVPTYYDSRYNEGIWRLLKDRGLDKTTIGELLDRGILTVHKGHGSPSNDQRGGTIPYIKVSDIREFRLNVNPTNLVSEVIAKMYWRGETSELKPWDVITPNRASSNIGEFAILLPGEENVVLTKEVFVFRVQDRRVWDPFYLLWALSLQQVRDQWRRIVLMQTNREDCGERYMKIILPKPKSRKWAHRVSAPFRSHFQTISGAKGVFIRKTSEDGWSYVPTIHKISPVVVENDVERI